MDNNDYTIPNTGFRLFPLIRNVLDASEATEPDALALEVLAQIPAYDRETALHQALRSLVRQQHRPKFIPAPSTSSAQVSDVPQQRTPENPPPERDGRQWIDRDSADEPRARNWAEVRANHPPNETAVAQHRAALDEQNADDAGDDAPGLRELATEPRRYTQTPAPVRPQEVESPFTGPMRGGKVTAPKSSPRVAAIREAWRRTLRQRIAVQTGHKFFGDCTVMDLEYAADQREQHAKRTQARADELRKLIDVMREHSVTTLKDLPVEVLANLEASLVTAAA